MKSLRRCVAAVALSALLTPGMAGTRASVAAQGDDKEVTVTYRLRVYGRPLSGETLRLDIDFVSADLCGPRGSNASRPCEGEGTVYTFRSPTRERGVTVDLVRLRVGRGERASIRTEIPTPRDVTVDLYYRYGDDGKPLGGGLGKWPPRAAAPTLPGSLPDTGGGGLDDTGRREQRGATALGALLASGCPR
jgi:hypothetical protein